MHVKELIEIMRKHYWTYPVLKDAPFPSTRRVAAHFGVSRETANQAINSLVAAGYLYRKGRSGTFFNARENSSYRVAIATLPTYYDPGRTQGLQAMVEYLTQAGVQIKVVEHNQLKNSDTAELALGDCDGLLVGGDLLDAPVIEHLKKFLHPIVVLFHDYDNSKYWAPGSEELPLHRVTLDLQKTCRRIAQVLPRDREILILAAQNNNGQFRRDEFVAALQRYNFDMRRVHEIPHSDSNPHSELNLYKAILNFNDTFKNKIVFSTSDMASVMALQILQNYGLVPGEGLDWISCDNQQQYGLSIPGIPELTTIDCFRSKTMVESAALLLRELKMPLKGQTILRLPTKLVVRQTTANIDFSGII